MMNFRLLILTKFTRFVMNGGKLEAAFAAITDGCPIEEVSECLDWRDFEGLVCHVLLENGFSVEKNVILTKPRMEIDVIGISLSAFIAKSRAMS